MQAPPAASAPDRDDVERPPTLAPVAIWAVLAAAMAACAALVLWLGRETTFSLDELSIFSRSPGLDLEGAFEPHNGHLAIAARFVYKAVFETIGTDYIAFRALTVGAVLVLAAVMFVYMSRRVGRTVALAPTVVLLFFGTDAPHLLQGNGFAIMISLAAGVGALLALERRDARGDVGACALLCAGVASFSVALPFVVGAAVSLWLRGYRRRLWVALVPAILYAAWLLWARGEPRGAEEQLDFSNLLLAPVWAFRSLAAIVGGLAGLDYDFTADAPEADAGWVLAAAAILALAWRLRRPDQVPASLWAALAVLVTFWVMGALVANDVRTPDSTRYMYPGAVIVLVVAAEAVAGIRWNRTAVIAVFAVAAIGLATNIALLRDGANQLRDEYTVDTRSALAGVELAGDSADPGFDPNDSADLAGPLRQSVVANWLAGGESNNDRPTGAYLGAVNRYGTVGYSAAEVHGLDETARIRTDSFLAGALALQLRTAARSAGADRRCEAAEALPGEPITARLPAEGALLTAEAAEGPVHVGRFASGPSVAVGTLTAGRNAVLEIPLDSAPEPWIVSMPGAVLTLCPLR